MKNNNLTSLKSAQSKIIKNNKLKSVFHKINLEQLEKIYSLFYYDNFNCSMQLNIQKEFNYCDLESLNLTEKFIGE